MIGGLLVALAVGSWYGAQTYFFTIDDVSIVEQVGVQPKVVPVKELRQLADGLKGDSLWLLSEQSLRTVWLERFPTIERITVEKRYPGTLVISYVPRVAFCQLVAPNGTYLVDRDGFIFAKSSHPTLPKLATNEILAGVGKQTSARGVKLGLNLVDGLRNAEPRVVDVLLRGNQLDITLTGDPKIYISDTRSAGPSLLEIKALLFKFKQENRYPKELDLRFERPLIRY
jgi:cell division septal protein FtsQ